MSIAGIPPFNGFWSKLIIIAACIQAHHFGYAFWAILASVLTLASFMKVQKYAFFGKLRKELGQIKEVPFSMGLSMVILAIICLIGGLLLIPAFREVFLSPAAETLLAGKDYAVSVFGSLK
jgi:multicomponent Na+:H+ antiporter subunit D